MTRHWTPVLVAVATACGARTELIVETPAESSPSPSDSAGSSSSTPASSSFGSASSGSASIGSASSSASSSATAEGVASGVVWFASGSEWASFVGTPLAPNSLSPDPGASLGPAQAVCVTAENPPNCPSGAVIYDNPLTPWFGGRSIPNALWIWRGDVSATELGDLQAALFAKSFTIGAQPTGSIQIAVDDFAEVFVNGASAGTTGSITVYDTASNGQNIAVTIDLTPLLVQGVNVIAVAAQNGPSSFGTDCGEQGCTYAQNPAGVVFAGSLSW